jgi:hypothetical protein
MNRNLYVPPEKDEIFEKARSLLGRRGMSDFFVQQIERAVRENYPVILKNGLGSVRFSGAKLPVLYVGRFIPGVAFPGYWGPMGKPKVPGVIDPFWTLEAYLTLAGNLVISEKYESYEVVDRIAEQGGEPTEEDVIREETAQVVRDRIGFFANPVFRIIGNVYYLYPPEFITKLRAKLGEDFFTEYVD